MIESLLNKLRRTYSLSGKKEAFEGSPKRFGRHFSSASYTVEKVGSFSVAEVSGAFGLIKREVAVLTPLYRDMPVFLAESRHDVGKDILWIGFADIMMKPLPDDVQEAFRGLKASYDRLPPAELPWTEGLPLYDFSLAVSGPEVGLIKEAVVRKFFMLYSDCIQKAPETDPEAKKEKLKECGECFLEAGSPLGRQLTRLLGREQTEAFYSSIFR